jgi:hypothetical protein
VIFETFIANLSFFSLLTTIRRVVEASYNFQTQRSLSRYRYITGGFAICFVAVLTALIVVASKRNSSNAPIPLTPAEIVKQNITAQILSTMNPRLILAMTFMPSHAVAGCPQRHFLLIRIAFTNPLRPFKNRTRR